jgi:hypothetical protein
MDTINAATLLSDTFIINSLDERKRREFFIKKNYIELYNRITSQPIKSENFSLMLFNYINKIDKIPTCICGEKLKFINYNQGYRRYCSKRCVMSDEDLIQKRNEKSKITSIIHWGVDNPMKNKEVVSKLVSSNIEKFGVENPTQLESIKEKIKKTNIEKWGTEWYQSTDDFKIKSKKTNFQKYGVEHHMKNREKIDNFKKNNFEKWGVDNYTKTSEFKLRMHNYLSSDRFEKTKEKNKLRKNEKIFNYYTNFNSDYKLLDIRNSELSLECDICEKIFTISKQLYYLRTKNKQVCCTHCNLKNSKTTSVTEKEILEFIKSNYDGTIIENFKIERREIDIFLPNLMLGFEFNGLYWHSELYKNKIYHFDKTKFFDEQGINLIHIWEDDWNFRQDIVKSMILNKIKKNRNIIYARKCQIKNISDNILIRNFLEKNHIQGFVGSKIKLGLFYKDELVSIMTFGNLRKSLGQKNKNDHYELLRFCNKLNTTVIGGASKLFKYFINNFNPIEIISYCNKSYSHGKIYSTIGMKENSTSIGYSWSKDGIRYNRFSFRKDTLIKQGYEGSETSIMNSRGFYRIWDCGQVKFTWNPS